MSDVDTTTTTTGSAPADTSAGDESGSRTESDASESFRAITTQAEFDALLKGRLSRAEKSVEKKFASQIADLEKIVHTFENEKLSEDEKRDKRLQEMTAAIAERDTKLKSYERKEVVSTLADEHKLPRKFWDRVRGETEDEIAADIKDLLEALPAGSDTKAPPKQGGTVRVAPTGDDGEREASAQSIIAAVDPNYITK